MGRRSLQKKRQKRQRQKEVKKAKKRRVSQESSTVVDERPAPDPSIVPTCHNSPDSIKTIFSLGSPGTPPSPSDSFLSDQSLSEAEFYGADGRSVKYECCSGKFDLSNGKLLEEPDMLDYVMKCNKALSDKAEMYRKQFEQSECEIGEMEGKWKRKLYNVRDFYKHELFSKHSRSVTMVQKALTNTP